MSHTCVIYFFLQYPYVYTHRCMFKHNKSCTDTGTYRHTHTHSRTHTHIHKHVGNQNMTMILQKNDLIELIFDIHIYIYTHVWVALRLMLQDYGCPIDASWQISLMLFDWFLSLSRVTFTMFHQISTSIVHNLGEWTGWWESCLCF